MRWWTQPWIGWVHNLGPRPPLRTGCLQMVSDVWRSTHPDVREYSCYSETHKTLSRVDTILAETEGL